MFSHLSEGDRKNALKLKETHDHVAHIEGDKFIVGVNGKYGVVSVDQGDILTCEYNKITHIGKFLEVHGQIMHHKMTLLGPVAVREKGLFNLSGTKIVTMGPYEDISEVSGFGVALFDTHAGVTILVSNTEKVRDDLKGNKLLDLNVEGYAALVHLLEGRAAAKLFVDLELNTYSNLYHLYDSVGELEGILCVANKGDKYTYVDEHGIPTTKDWYEKF